MNELSMSSLRDRYRAVVFGASGGIGGAMARLLRADPRCGALYLGARRAPAPIDGARPFSFDLLDEPSIDAAAQEILAEGAPDLVIVATGVLHDALLTPEKTIRALSAEVLARSFALNAIGPALIAKRFLPALPREGKSVFAALSARVSSLSDNRTGGWHSYRAAKAALNMLIRNGAIELAHRNKAAICVALHPGTVDTAMSAPFKAGVSPEKLFSPGQSAMHLLRVMDGLASTDSGKLFAWDGAEISF